MKSVFWFAVLFSGFGGLSASNMDSNITEFVKRYISAKHRPYSIQVVYTFADLYNIIEVNEKEESITLKLWMYAAYILDIPESAWNDSLPGLFQFFPGKGSVWLPDIVILNSVKIVETSFDSPIVRKGYSCDADGTNCVYGYTLVVFPFSRTQITTCSFDVSEFPFDSQKCDIVLGPWFTDLTTYPRMYFGTYGAYYIQHPIENTTSMTLYSFKGNSQWTLVKASLSYGTREAQHDTLKKFDTMIYSLHLKRKPEFYVNSLVMPCLILTLLIVLSIILPVESGEKMGLGVTILLAQVVNLMILSGIIPASSQHFPQLGYYFLITIGLIAVSIMYNAVNIMIYYYDYSTVFTLILKKGRNVVSPTHPGSLFSATAASDSSPSPDFTKEDNGYLTVGGNPNPIKAFSIESTVATLVESVEHVLGEEDQSTERRKKFCIITDHIFGVLLLIVILIVHGVYFLPYI